MSRPPFLQRLSRKLDKTIAAWLFIDQWVILAGRHRDHKVLDWRAWTALLPPKDRYWADPFVLQRGDGYTIFIEEKIYAAGRGHIACLTVDQDGAILSQQVALQRPYHLSYPFVFEHQGELYMLPESAANRTVELYRCTRFPDQWEYVKNLLSDIFAVDATLLQHAGKWWLFANEKTPGGSSLDALHLYYSTDLLTGSWQAHPRNPIVKDLHGARPAGRIFTQDGGLIRPAQDSFKRYGYALKFKRITKLDETDYSEEPAGEFTPRGSRYLATHTFNQAGDMTVIDAVLRREKKG